MAREYVECTVDFLAFHPHSFLSDHKCGFKPVTLVVAEVIHDSLLKADPFSQNLVITQLPADKCPMICRFLLVYEAAVRRNAVQRQYPKLIEAVGTADTQQPEE